MSKGKSWAKGYKAPIKGQGCPNGKKKCWACMNPELAAFKLLKAGPWWDDYAADTKEEAY